MFIETYYDETKSALVGAGEQLIPYPELVGEDLAAWRQYLPITTALGTWFELTAPGRVQLEVKRLRETRLFDRIEIWARKDPDPMAVGIIAPDGEKIHYYSIARWGDAEITLQEVKKKLRLQELLSRAILCAAILLVLASIFLVASTYTKLPNEAAASELGYAALSAQADF